MTASSVAGRFIRYAKVDTQSDASSKTCPSTPGQIDLAKLLLQDLLEAGCTKVILDKNGYVTATLESNVSGSCPVIGLIAHMDTSPDFSGKNVNPRIISGYDGLPVALDAAGWIILSPEDFPELIDYKGQDLIVTDGSTLLGADDKAGIAEIIEAVSRIHEHPEIPHGRIRICFTPDEEIGRGADLFDLAAFHADFAYTLDGGPIGQLEYENFNAAGAVIRIQGRNVHPGTAKDKMINALQLAIDIHHQLPHAERPELTEGYQGFYHLTKMEGTVEAARMEYIIRDHDRVRFEEKKKLLSDIASEFNKRYPPGTIEIRIKDQYYNMNEKIEPVIHIVDLAAQAMKLAGIEPVISPIRGGTDGAKLSHNGLPTPNLFTGGHNYHGKFEFIPVQSMEKAVEVIINLLRLAAGPA
jgi:tripeptide aminopeptidase